MEVAFKVMEILVLVILILINAFFAASEIALISLNDNKVKMMAEEGDKKAMMLQRLLSEPSRFLATIQIGITLAGFMASAFAADSFSESLADVIMELGVPVPYATLETISLIVITLLLSYFTLVLGELVPKRLAMKKGEAISQVAVTPLTILSKVTAPFVKLLTVSTNIIVRIFGVDPHANDENVTEEEIRMMIDVGEESGTIDASEKEMINNIFEFDDKTASDIMTHRTNMVSISIDSSLKDTVDIVNIEKYTRYPVYKQDIDKIVGVLHGKDLIQFIENENKNGFSLSKLIRDPFFVLEAIKIDDLFREMQKNNIHLAIVLDEYGGTAGIITIEDIIEEIVGNIFDEYDDPEMEVEIKELGDNTYLINGTTMLYDVEDLLGIEFPDQDNDTLGGFVISQLGYFPDNKERTAFEYNDFLFKIEEMNDKRILKVLVQAIEKEEIEDNQESKREK